MQGALLDLAAQGRVDLELQHGHRVAAGTSDHDGTGGALLGAGDLVRAMAADGATSGSKANSTNARLSELPSSAL